MAEAPLQGSDSQLAEIERLREINRQLVDAHNSLLVALARSEDDAEALRDLFGPRGDVETVLREVSRDFAGAHVNADVVLGAIRKALSRCTCEPPHPKPKEATT